jgi:hypothetical protein
LTVFFNFSKEIHEINLRKFSFNITAIFDHFFTTFSKNPFGNGIKTLWYCITKLWILKFFRVVIFIIIMVIRDIFVPSFVTANNIIYISRNKMCADCFVATLISTHNHGWFCDSIPWQFIIKFLHLASFHSKIP